MGKYANGEEETNVNRTNKDSHYQIVVEKEAKSLQISTVSEYQMVQKKAHFKGVSSACTSSK